MTDTNKMYIYPSRSKGKTVNIVFQKEGGGDLSADQAKKAAKMLDHFNKAEGLKKSNPDLALKYYKLAADVGDFQSQIKVAEMLEKKLNKLNFTDDSKENKELVAEIVKYLELARKKSNLAGVQLGLIYYHGKFNQKIDLKKAYECFEQAASDGKEGAALYYQGCCLMHGKGVEKNTERGMALLHNASSLKDVLAKIELGICYEKGIGVLEKDEMQAFYFYQEAYREAKKQKNTYDDPNKIIYKTLCHLIRCYISGIGTKVDHKQAAELMSLMPAPFKIPRFDEGYNDAINFIQYLTADENDAEAPLKIAEYFFSGKGVGKDIKLGMEYLEKAANNKNVEAILKLGTKYLAGDGVKKNPKKAMEYFTRALEEFQDKSAQYYLGLCKIVSGTTEEEHSDGFRLLEKSKNAGDCKAKVRVGWCYRVGRGVHKDVDKAVEILNECIEEEPDNPDVMNMLADTLLFFLGRKEDRERAFLLLEKAKSDLLDSLEHEKDQTNLMLALCYYFGYGTPKDLNEMIHHLNLAKADSLARTYLSMCHYLGLGVAKNDDTAIEQLKELVRENCPEAMNCAGMFSLLGLWEQKPNPKKAFNFFKEACRDPVSMGVEAINNQGWCYLHGLGDKKNYEKAVQLFEEARKQGNCCAINNLAWCYLNGFGVPKNEGKARSLFLEAKNLSSQTSAPNTFGICYLNFWSADKEIERLHNPKNLSEQYNLALCYLEGWGVKKEPKIAIEMLTKLATEHNDLKAKWKLGVCYLHGLGFEKSAENDKQAIIHFQTIIESTTNESFDLKWDAYVQLALCQFFGRGLPPNRERGIHLLEICSNHGRGHPMAHYYLGLFAESKGDKKQAVEYYTKASQAKVPEALRHLGLCYEAGEGIEKDLKKAVEYYQQALNEGDGDARALLTQYKNEMRTDRADRGDRKEPEARAKDKDIVP